MNNKGGIAQKEERWAHNPDVSGSTPLPATNVK